MLAMGGLRGAKPRCGLWGPMMLAEVLLAFAVLLLVLALLDLYLTDTQKLALSNVTVRMWDQLDETKEVYFRVFVRPREIRISFMFIAGFYVIIGVALIAFLTSSKDHLLTLFLAGVLVAIPALLFGFLFVGMAVTATTIFERLRWLVVYPFIGITALGVLSLGNQILAAPLYFIYFSVVILVMFLMFAVLPFFLFFLIIIVLWASEITVRRIAESSKGPIIIISGLLAAIGGLLKLWE